MSPFLEDIGMITDATVTDMKADGKPGYHFGLGVGGLIKLNEESREAQFSLF